MAQTGAGSFWTNLKFPHQDDHKESVDAALDDQNQI